MAKKMNLFDKVSKLFITSFIITFVASNIYSSNLVGYKNIEKYIISIATEAESFSTLPTALQKAVLIKIFKSKSSFTVFAPTDAAFEKLTERTFENPLTNKDALREILNYHVVKGNFLSKNVAQYKSAKTLSNNVFNIESKNDNFFVNNAKIIASYIKISNGVI